MKYGEYLLSCLLKNMTKGIILGEWYSIRCDYVTLIFLKEYFLCWFLGEYESMLNYLKHTNTEHVLKVFLPVSPFILLSSKFQIPATSIWRWYQPAVDNKYIIRADAESVSSIEEIDIHLYNGG
jgi:hypothetical protein